MKIKKIASRDFVDEPSICYSSCVSGNFQEPKKNNNTKEVYEEAYASGVSFKNMKQKMGNN